MTVIVPDSAVWINNPLSEHLSFSSFSCLVLKEENWESFFSFSFLKGTWFLWLFSDSFAAVRGWVRWKHWRLKLQRDSFLVLTDDFFFQVTPPRPPFPNYQACLLFCSHYYHKIRHVNHFVTFLYLLNNSVFQPHLLREHVFCTV